MMKYVWKFALDIMPSVVATIIGAYIVNHYIVTKPGADAPVAAAVSSADPKAEAKAVPEAAKSDAKFDAKAAETSADIANLPEPGVRAKGISEKAVLERPSVEKSTEKSTDRPAEAAGARRLIAPREKTAAKTVAVPMQPSVSAAMPVVAAPTTALPIEAATAPEERRDANDLARAAIERLRGTNDGTARAQEAARTPDAARVPDAPRVVSAPPVRPLPPPIMVSTPANEAFDSTAGSSPMKPPYTVDPRRPTPPADIPYARPPLDLRAEAGDPSTREHTSVAEDVLSAAKSVFHAVLPK
jgi:hypothetical protein